MRPLVRRPSTSTRVRLRANNSQTCGRWPSRCRDLDVVATVVWTFPPLQLAFLIGYDASSQTESEFRVSSPAFTTTYMSTISLSAGCCGRRSSTPSVPIHPLPGRELIAHMRACCWSWVGAARLTRAGLSDSTCARRCAFAAALFLSAPAACEVAPGQRAALRTRARVTLAVARCRLLAPATLATLVYYCPRPVCCLRVARPALGFPLVLLASTSGSPEERRSGVRRHCGRRVLP